MRALSVQAVQVCSLDLLEQTFLQALVVQDDFVHLGEALACLS